MWWVIKGVRKRLLFHYFYLRTLKDKTIFNNIRWEIKQHNICTFFLSTTENYTELYEALLRLAQVLLLIKFIFKFNSRSPVLSSHLDFS